MLKLYSQPTCGQCRAIHMRLDSKGIKYDECQDIDYMTSIGIRQTPALEIETEENGEMIKKVLYGPEIIKYINGVK